METKVHHSKKGMIMSVLIFSLHFYYAQNGEIFERVFNDSLEKKAEKILGVKKNSIMWKKHKDDYYVAFTQEGKTLMITKEGKIISNQMNNIHKESSSINNEMFSIGQEKLLTIKKLINNEQIKDLRVFKDNKGLVYEVITEEHLYIINEKDVILYKLFR